MASTICKFSEYRYMEGGTFFVDVNKTAFTRLVS